jgi:transposase
MEDSVDTAEEGTAASPAVDEGSRPRRNYSIAQKRAILEETRQPGCSVALVAKRHAIHTSLIFGWRRLLRKGLLTERSADTVPLLPVKVATPTMLPRRRAKAQVGASPALDGAAIQVEFADGHRLRLQMLEAPTLLALIKTLSGR